MTAALPQPIRLRPILQYQCRHHACRDFHQWSPLSCRTDNASRCRAEIPVSDSHLPSGLAAAVFGAVPNSSDSVLPTALAGRRTSQHLMVQQCTVPDRYQYSRALEVRISLSHHHHYRMLTAFSTSGFIISSTCVLHGWRRKCWFSLLHYQFVLDLRSLNVQQSISSLFSPRIKIADRMQRNHGRGTQQYHCCQPDMKVLINPATANAIGKCSRW